mmetsp:Transcript_21137/g.44572  ORF Transcript_21137/g.44572 Transcript_21137/m.44572 type:complete len:242 (+) Transcript_21137:320-1045(+)
MVKGVVISAAILSETSVCARVRSLSARSCAVMMSRSHSAGWSGVALSSSVARQRLTVAARSSTSRLASSISGISKAALTIRRNTAPCRKLDRYTPRVSATCCEINSSCASSRKEGTFSETFCTNLEIRSKERAAMCISKSGLVSVAVMSSWKRSEQFCTTSSSRKRCSCGVLAVAGSLAMVLSATAICFFTSVASCGIAWSSCPIWSCCSFPTSVLTPHLSGGSTRSWPCFEKSSFSACCR